VCHFSPLLCCAVLSGLHSYDKQASGKWLLMVVRYSDYWCCLTHSVEQSLGKLIVPHLLKNWPHSMENEGSILCSQQPTTGSSPEPDVPGSVTHLVCAAHVAVVSANMLETLCV
jgi:hypothetical protein